jgi:MFS superfamily sulfate permease-like transporter
MALEGVRPVSARSNRSAPRATPMAAALAWLGRIARTARAWCADGARRPAPGGSVPPDVLVYEVSGPLRLGAAQRAMTTLRHVGPPVRAVVLLLDGAHTLDATGVVALEGALDAVASYPAVAVLAGLQPQPLAMLRAAAVLDRRGVQLGADAEDALRLAALAARGEVSPTPALRPAGE